MGRANATHVRNRLIAGGLLLACCAVPLGAADDAKPAEPTASFHFDRARAELVFETLEELYGVRFVTEGTLEAPLSVNSRGPATLERMVELVDDALRAQGLAARRDKRTVRVVPMSLAAAKVEMIRLHHSDPKEVAQIVNTLHDTPNLLRDTTTENAELVRKLLAQMDRHGEALLSGSLKVTAIPYPRLRAVIVRAPEVHMDAIRTFIVETLDKKVEKPKPRRKPPPPSAETTKIAGEAAYRSGDESQALKLLEYAYERGDTFDPKLANLLMKIYLRRGMPHKARGVIERFLDQPGQKDNPTALLALARLEADSGRYSQALKHVRQVLKDRPDNKEAQDLELALTAVTGGDAPVLPGGLEYNEQTVRILLRRMIGTWLDGQQRQALGLMETLRARSRGDALVTSRLAGMYIEAGRVSDARKLLARALRDAEAPDAAAAERAPTANDWLRLEQALLDEPDAQKRYERRLAAAGRIDEPLSRALTTAQLAAISRREAAYLAHLEQAAALDPTATGVVERLFRHAVNARDWDRAQRWVDLARAENVDGADGALYAARLQAARDLFRPEVPKPPPPQRRRVYRLDYVSADYIARTAQQLLRLRPYAEDRINAVIFESDKSHEHEELAELIALLDVPESLELDTFHVKLNNATAREVRRILEQLYRHAPRALSAEALEQLSEAEREKRIDEAAGALTDAGVAADVARRFVTGSLGMAVGDVKIIEDTMNNALLIRTHPRNIEPIMQVVRQLDAARDQVMIKVLVAEVKLDDTTETGIDFLYQDVDPNTRTQKYNMDFNMSASSTGLTYTYISDNIDAFVRAIKTSTRLNVLSRPQVLTLDNQQAEVEFGKKVPLLQTTKVTAEGSVNSTVKYEKVVTRLEVTPHVNAAGFIRLDIEQTIDDTSADTFAITEQLAPRILTTRKAITHVQIRDGQTVCLGGFIGDSIDDTDTKVPFLGDLPVLGAAFSSRNRTRVKSELLIFITPYLLKTPEELLSMTNQVRSRSVAPRHRRTPPPELYYRDAVRDNPHTGWMRTTQRYTIPGRAKTEPTSRPAEPSRLKRLNADGAPGDGAAPPGR